MGPVVGMPGRGRIVIALLPSTGTSGRRQVNKPFEDRPPLLTDRVESGADLAQILVRANHVAPAPMPKHPSEAKPVPRDV